MPALTGLRKAIMEALEKTPSSARVFGLPAAGAASGAAIGGYDNGKFDDARGAVQGGLAGAVGGSLAAHGLARLRFSDLEPMLHTPRDPTPQSVLDQSQRLMQEPQQMGRSLADVLHPGKDPYFTDHDAGLGDGLPPMNDHAQDYTDFRDAHPDYFYESLIGHLPDRIAFQRALDMRYSDVGKKPPSLELLLELAKSGDPKQLGAFLGSLGARGPSRGSPILSAAGGLIGGAAASGTAYEALRTAMRSRMAKTQGYS